MPNEASTAPPFEPPSIDLRGRVAIVTGASRGIGRATAETLAAAGAAVVLTGRSLEPVAEVAQSIIERGGRALPFAAHAGEPESADALAEATLEAFGAIDILVNNAGTCPHYGPLLDASEALWDKTMDVNLRGPWRTARACVPAMRARGGGAIVNVSSIAGLIPQNGVGLYCLSKAGLVMMTQVLAAELAPEGVRVHAVAPGFVRTRFSRGMWDDDAERTRMLDEIPQGRIGEPEEIARAIAFLVSDWTPFATGSTFVADGGQLVAAGMWTPG